MRDLEGLLEPVYRLAVEAGEATLKHFRREVSVETKADRSPVTAADKAAHEVLVRGLASLAPEIPVLSEESAPAEYEARRGWSRYWCVDPLDGTKEFLRGTGEYTVNVALIEGGRSRLGMVYQPTARRAFRGLDGVGAARRDGDDPWRPIRVRDADPAALTLMLSASHAAPAMLDYLAGRPGWTTRQAGSSLKFCLVAAGEADLYPRSGPTMEWDTAAAQCVVEQAGGRVLDWDGAPLRYNKAELKNPALMTVGDAAIDWRSLVAAVR